MLFSIVIPVYNVESYLEECIESIVQQLDVINNDCEILLIDDGSTDHSGDICDKYQLQYPNIIKVFHKENEGLLATRRYGFQRSNGQYIVNCDSDDFLESDMLESLQEAIVNFDEPDVILFNYKSYKDVKKIVLFENIFSNEVISDIYKEQVLNEFLVRHSIVSMWGKVCKRSCIDIDDDYKDYKKLSTGEDTLQSIEILSNASSFVYVNKALYNYRSGSGMTTTFDKDYYFTFKKIFKKIKEKEDNWNIENFSELFAIKVLQTAGRAITQSRYFKWDSVVKQKEYLLSIRYDDMFQDNIKYISKIKKYLQIDHYFLLNLLQNRCTYLICFLLKLKNSISHS